MTRNRRRQSPETGRAQDGGSATGSGAVRRARALASRGLLALALACAPVPVLASWDEPDEPAVPAGAMDSAPAAGRGGDFPAMPGQDAGAPTAGAGIPATGADGAQAVPAAVSAPEGPAPARPRPEGGKAEPRGEGEPPASVTAPPAAGKGATDGTPAPAAGGEAAPPRYFSEPWQSPGAHIVRGRVSPFERWAARGPVTGGERVPAPERAMERRRVDGEDLVVRGRVERLNARQSAAAPRLSVPLLPGEGGRILEESAQLHGFETAFHHEPLDSDGWPLRWSRKPVFRPDTRLPGGGTDRTASGTALRDLAKPVRGVGLPGPVLVYRDLAARHAARFGLKTSLVLAVIHAESLGRPDLVSPRDAVGLMQVQPHMAGSAVSGMLGDAGGVTAEALMDPDRNIAAGAAYLRLLERRYFRGVTDPVSRNLCVIAAFNAGPGGLLRYFGRSAGEALAAINEFTAEALYEEMTARMVPMETRRYVAKVFYLEQVYRGMGF